MPIKFAPGRRLEQELGHEPHHRDDRHAQARDPGEHQSVRRAQDLLLVALAEPQPVERRRGDQQHRGERAGERDDVAAAPAPSISLNVPVNGRVSRNSEQHLHARQHDAHLVQELDQLPIDALLLGLLARRRRLVAHRSTLPRPDVQCLVAPVRSRARVPCRVCRRVGTRCWATTAWASEPRARCAPDRAGATSATSTPPTPRHIGRSSMSPSTHTGASPVSASTPPSTTCCWSHEAARWRGSGTTPSSPSHTRPMPTSTTSPRRRTSSPRRSGSPARRRSTWSTLPRHFFEPSRTRQRYELRGPEEVETPSGSFAATR